MDDFFPVAAKKGRFEILDWLHEKSCPDSYSDFPGTTPNAFNTAAIFGRLEIMKWLDEKGYAWDHRTLAFVSCIGHIDIMKWLLEKGCFWSTLVSPSLVMHGSLEKIIWAKEMGIHLMQVPARPLLKQET